MALATASNSLMLVDLALRQVVALPPAACQAAASQAAQHAWRCLQRLLQARLAGRLLSDILSVSDPQLQQP